MRICPKAVLLILLFITLINYSALHGETQKPLEIGIDEKPGEYVPLDLSFRDENNAAVSLKELVSRPTVLSLVYYHCPGICNPLLGGLAEVIGKSELEMGKDYNVLTISFDPKDTPPVALDKKKNYLELLKKDSKESWRFLTGDDENINKLTDAVGFRFKKDGEEFIHSAALIVLSPDGKIIRYLYGITFLPFDLNMAVTEANQGRIGPTIRKALLFCYKYDPKGRKYALNVTRLAGAAIIIFAGAFFSYLTITGRKRGKKAE